MMQGLRPYKDIKKLYLNVNKRIYIIGYVNGGCPAADSAIQWLDETKQQY